MNNVQRVLVGRILDWSERGFVENDSAAWKSSVASGVAVGGGSRAFSDFEAAAIELARSLVTQSAEELNRDRMALSRMLPEGAVAEAAGLEIPGFFEHEKGPALTFMPAMEDRARKLYVQYRVDGAWSMIKLEPGDVRQARAFFDAWLRLAEGSRVEVELKPEPEGQVTVYDRKYRFYRKPGDYRVHVDRHGEPWLVIEQGCNAVAALMDELIEAREWIVEWKNANTELVSRVAQLQIDQNGGQVNASIRADRDRWRQVAGERAAEIDRLCGKLQGAVRRERAQAGANTRRTVQRKAPEVDEVEDETPRGIRESLELLDSVSLPRGWSEDQFVHMLDERVAEFRRLYANESLEAFLAWCRARISPAVRVAFEIAVEPRLREPPKAAPAPLDTMNRFLVTAHDGEVLVRKPLTFSVFSATEALQLASWLIAGADLANYDRPLETVIATVKAIQST